MALPTDRQDRNYDSLFVEVQNFTFLRKTLILFINIILYIIIHYNRAFSKNITILWDEAAKILQATIKHTQLTTEWRE